MSIISFSLLGQGFNIDIQNPVLSPCPSDPNVMVYSYKNWSLYQTDDDTWSGKRYQGSCPNLFDDAHPTNGSNYFRVDLSTIDSDKALFLAYEGPEVELGQNNIYALFNSFNPNLPIPVKYGDDCPNGMCSGLIMRSRHHEEMSSDTLICDTYYPYTNTSSFDLYPCFVSEKTERNTLVSAIYKLTLEEITDTWVTPGTVWLQNWGAVNVIENTVTVKEEHFNEDQNHHNSFYL